MTRFVHFAFDAVRRQGEDRRTPGPGRGEHRDCHEDRVPHCVQSKPIRRRQARFPQGANRACQRGMVLRMGERSDRHLAIPVDPRLDALAKVAAMLEWPLPRERDQAVCAEAARVIDRLLAPFARSRGAIDVAIGEGLDLLSTGDRVLRLGYSGIGDYARERLGIAASTARKMARLARELRDRPLVRLAVQSGEMSVRQAEAILPVARGDAEASWVSRGRTDTVRGLKAAVKA